MLCDQCPPRLLESQRPCTMHILLFFHSLPSLGLEWNSNPSETDGRNRVYYDIEPIGDFHAGAGFVSVLLLQQCNLEPTTPKARFHHTPML